jgi:hypothetical protein
MNEKQKKLNNRLQTLRAYFVQDSVKLAERFLKEEKEIDALKLNNVCYEN